MKRTNIYYCKSITEASDRANLFYIASNTANNMIQDNASKTITVTNKRQQVLAVFAY